MPTDDTRWNPHPTRKRSFDNFSDETVETIARGEEILDQAKEVARAIDERVHHLIDQTRDGWAGARTGPDAHGS